MMHPLAHQRSACSCSAHRSRPAVRLPASQRAPPGRRRPSRPSALAAPPPAPPPPSPLERSREEYVHDDEEGVAHVEGAGAQAPGLADLDGPARMFKASLDAILERYYAASPRAVAAIERLYGAGSGLSGAPPELQLDHIAFRTFGLPGLGIDTLSEALAAFGYRRAGGFLLPGRKITAAWFAPPPVPSAAGMNPGLHGPGGAPAYELLPRVLVTQVEVAELSPAAQAIIRRHAAGLSGFGPTAAWAAALTWALPWGASGGGVGWEEYAELLEESEYAAWVLVNGYAISHAALACHRFPASMGAPAAAAAATSHDACGGDGGGALRAAYGRLASRGFSMNTGASGGSGSGGDPVTSSADGLMGHASTVADLREFWFAGGREPSLVPGSYLELVERRPLPQFAAGPSGSGRPAPGAAFGIGERHRRDGFDPDCCAAALDSTLLAAREAAALAEEQAREAARERARAEAEAAGAEERERLRREAEEARQFGW